MKLTLVSSEHGFFDFDVEGQKEVRRVCVPMSLKRGGTFNVHTISGRKVGVEWLGYQPRLDTAEKYIQRSLDAHQF